MKRLESSRRAFLKKTALAAGGSIILPPAIAWAAPPPPPAVKAADAKIRFSVIGINHSHINAMVDAVTRGGGQLVAVYAKEPDLLAGFMRRYPAAKKAAGETEILEDSSIHLILSSGIPVDRAPLGIKVMQHGKDYLVDKPGIITLDQLAEVRKVQKQTKRIYSVMFSERLENRGSVKAGELVQAGAIGKVVQTVNLAPHKMSPRSRPEWFFDPKYYGGIITDIGSHQFDQYLFYTGTTKAEITAAQVGNVHNSQYPKFEDFGDAMVHGNGGMGYVRLDWFTPESFSVFGDGRLTILGTDGFIEVRKYIDIGGRSGGSHVFLTDKKGVQYIDCSNQVLPFGEQFVNDVINRTETAMPQAHCLLATELALQAQAKAKRLDLKL